MSDLEQDHRALTNVIEELLDDGLRIPCIRSDTRQSAAWLSDNPKRQEIAATQCMGCLAIRECRRYVAKHPKEAGVWGGTTEKDRRNPDVLRQLWGGVL
ncbi:WhiB family transcriptional regulator [Luteimicrobium sp. NPDC057192]|uniref:WhiB family transcriptional regulator n=1 Tax=Luteimicrobium sp. NPDC057192 TaxID=3346042 RepID=UPI003639A6C8